MKRRPRTLAWGLPALLLLTIGLALPLFTLVLEVTRNSPFSGYVSSKTILHVQIITLRIAFLTTLLSIALAFIAALLLRRAVGMARQIALALALFPTGVHIVFRAFGVQILLGTEGPIKHLVISMPDILFTESATVLGLVHWTFPVSLLPILFAIWNLSGETRAAAELMGIPSHVILWRIELPQLIPIFALTAVLVFCLSYGAFITPALLGGLEDITLSRLIGALLSEGHSADAALPALVGVITPLLLLAAISLATKRNAVA